MHVLTNPLFLTRLAGLIALVVSLYFPGTSEEKVAGLITVALSFVAGKFEKQPDVAKPPPSVGQGGPTASGNAAGK